MKQNRNQITAYLNNFLKISDIPDSSYNGLQIEGKEEISKIAFAVDAGIETFEKAKQINADMIIVHHGLFWNGTDTRFVGVNKKRIEILTSSGINLYAAHLPLDMHTEVGNNVELLRIVGAQPTGKFWNHRDNFIGAVGKLSTPTKVSEISSVIETELNCKPSVLGESREVLTIAAASGGVGLDAVRDTKDAGADLLIVGEKRDFYHLANDLELSVIFAGHHASEQTGIWSLQKHIYDRFQIECVYIECPTNL